MKMRTKAQASQNLVQCCPYTTAAIVFTLNII